jgi:hypothetical protein
MTYIIVDDESDGPAPGRDMYSMVAMGAVALTPEGPDYDNGFLAYFKPISELWIPEALAISGFTREETLEFPPAEEGIVAFHKWLEQYPKPWVFCSDNPCYDWLFYAWYSWYFTNSNPMGFSGRRIGDLYCGLKGNAQAGWKHLRKTKHTHNPKDDAAGNAEALYWIFNNGVKARL